MRKAALASLLLIGWCAHAPVRAWAPHVHVRRAACAPRTHSCVACESAAHLDAAPARAEALLLALEEWLRRQPISSVLSRQQASALLDELRSDRRFWAQQRRQFARVWDALVEGLSQETRPLAVVLGAGTCERLLDALEQMDEQPAAVNAVLRSEVVEKMLGHVLYEGIFEFIQQADFFGNLINGLPIIGPIRVQVMKAARERLTLILGDQLMKFLGEYSAAAAEGAVQFVLNDDNRPYFRRARRRLGKKLLETPIANLVALNDLEMAILRDSIWTAIQEFRLPNEDDLLDALYEEFGAEPFAILLPTQSQAVRGDAPFFEAARDVLQGTLSKFLISDDWRRWSASDVRSQGLLDGQVEDVDLPRDEGDYVTVVQESDGVELGTADAPAESDLDGDGATPSQPVWDGWD